jgi:hypothetical protein
MRTFLLTRRASQNNEAKGYSSKGCKTVRIAFALSLLGMVASSCGGKPISLEERVKEYWQLRIEKKTELTYEFEAPGAPDKQTYLRKILTAPVVFTKYTIQSIKENGDEAEVELRVEYLLPGLSRSASSSMLDKWVKVKGRWYHMLPPAGEDGASPEERR